LVLPRLKHIIVYAIEGDILHIVRVLHTARDWPPDEE
jgi:plasmid stabilization system protein ParE